MRYPENLEFSKVKYCIKKYCQSRAGQNLVDKLQPYSSKEEIDYHLNLTEEVQILLKERVHFDFSYLSEIKSLLFETDGQVYDFSEFQKIIRNQQIVEEIIRSEDRYELYPLFSEKAEQFVSLNELVERFSKIYNEDGDVRDNASSTLYSIRKRQKQVRRNIMGVLQKKLEDYSKHSYLQDSVVTQRDGRFVVPLKRSSAPYVSGILHGESGSGNSVFMEPAEVVNLNNEVHMLEDDEHREIYRIVREYSNAVIQYRKELQKNTEQLSELDALYAVALWAQHVEAKKPQILEKPVINLTRARHPLLIETLESIDRVIPFNLELGIDFGILVISGPNTGGKTVTLKTVGLLVIMALSGVPIPAESDSQIGIFDAIYADIGDNQSLENSLSTFSSHIARLKEMLESEEKDVLILADEIGSATDPEQGSALAQVVLESLSARNFLGIVTTHYTALKVFAENDSHCINAAMQFDSEKHEPTYQIKLGLPGNSFAIEVAARLGMKREVIERARILAGRQNVELTDLIRKMSEEKKELSRQVYQYELKNSLLRQKVDEVQRKIDKLNKDTKAIKKESSREAREFLNSLQKELNFEIDQIKKTNRETRKQKYEEELKKVVRMNNELDLETFDDDLNGRSNLEEVNIGQHVFVKDIESEGIVVEISRSRIKVDLDGMIYTTQMKNLYTASKKEKKSEVSSSSIPSPKAKFELKLLGYRYEEAMPEVEKLIDEAMLSGLNYVRIVHGKGTGALRQKIRNYLRRNKNVAEYFTPAPEAGGDGVTVCKLRAE